MTSTANDSHSDDAGVERTDGSNEIAAGDIARVREILTWLPTDTETVALQYRPRLVGVEVEADVAHPSVGQIVEFLVSQPLLCIREDRYWQQLRDLTINHAVLGARRFRPPTGLGGSRFDGCEVYEFSEASVPKLKTVLDQLYQDSDEVIDVAGARVAVFSEFLEQDEWNFYVTSPEPALLLRATEQHFLEQVLLRRRIPPDQLVLPEDSEVWRHVERASSFVLIRQFRRYGVNEDFTSPYSDESAWPDDKAKALIYSRGNRDATVAHVLYLSDNNRAAEIAEDAWTTNPWSTGYAEIDKSAEGVIQISHLVEISHPVKTQEDVLGFFFDLLMHFGFEIVF